MLSIVRDTRRRLIFQTVMTATGTALRSFVRTRCPSATPIGRQTASSSPAANQARQASRPHDVISPINARASRRRWTSLRSRTLPANQKSSVRAVAELAVLRSLGGIRRRSNINWTRIWPVVNILLPDAHLSRVYRLRAEVCASAKAAGQRRRSSTS